MSDARELEERNDRLREAYERGREMHRPKTEVEWHALESAARAAVEDPSKVIAYRLLATPQNLLSAYAAHRWDEKHPDYECRLCKDGDELPKGYVCQRCGADNPHNSW